MINEINKFLTVSWLSGLLSAEIFISTGEWGVQMPPLTSENSHFLRSGPQEATLVMILKFSGVITIDSMMSMQKVKVKGQGHRSWTHLALSGPKLQFEFTYADEMMHKAWCCLEEVPFFFKVIHQISRSHGTKNCRFWPELSVSEL